MSAPSAVVTGIGTASGLDPDLASRLTLHQTRRLDRLSQLLLAAALEAAASARLHEIESDRIGIVVGTGLGCIDKTEGHLHGLARGGLAYADPLGFPDSMDNAPAAHTAIALGCRGPSFTVREREISGESATLLGLHLIASDAATAVVVAAGDAPGPAAENVLRRFASRLPFGESAGALVLEAAKSAERRGATPLASVAGYGRAFARPASRVGRASDAVVMSAVSRALASAGFSGGDTFLVPENALQAKNGWCPGDGVLRIVHALSLLPGAGGRAALVRGSARGEAAAALVLAPWEPPHCA